jgi:hypothetical protein
MKTSTFKSQLYVFADKFDERFENLFEGKVIIDFDFHSRRRSAGNDDIYTLLYILAANGQTPKSGRIVLNFDRESKKDILAYQTIALSYNHFIGFLFDKKRGFSKLQNFDDAFKHLDNVENFRNHLNHFDITKLVKSITPATKTEIASKTKQMVASIDEYIVLARQTSYRKFLSSFAL